MLDWLRRLILSYLQFSVTVLAGAEVYSWLFGYDDEMRAWASHNRLSILVVLILSLLMYAMYFWLKEDHK